MPGDILCCSLLNSWLGLRAGQAKDSYPNPKSFLDSRLWRFNFVHAEFGSIFHQSWRNKYCIVWYRCYSRRYNKSRPYCYSKREWHDHLVTLYCHCSGLHAKNLRCKACHDGHFITCSPLNIHVVSIGYAALVRVIFLHNLVWKTWFCDSRWLEDYCITNSYNIFEDTVDHSNFHHEWNSSAFIVCPSGSECWMHCA